MRKFKFLLAPIAAAVLAALRDAGVAIGLADPGDLRAPTG